MRLKQLFKGTYQVVAVMDGDDCAAYDFMLSADAKGLQYMLAVVAEKGLGGVPSPWFHSANPGKTVFAFRKGDFRLFFFKGKDKQIAVCTAGGRKQGQKADKALASAADDLRKAYEAACAANTIEVIEK